MTKRRGGGGRGLHLEVLVTFLHTHYGSNGHNRSPHGRGGCVALLMPRTHKVLERQEKGHKRERDQIRSHYRPEEEPMEKRVPTGRGSPEQHLSFGPSSGDVTHLAGHQPLHRGSGCTGRLASTHSPFGSRRTATARQDQASAPWQYQWKHRQHHHQQCKQQHHRDQRQDHHRHQRGGMCWREPRWSFTGRYMRTLSTMRRRWAWSVRMLSSPKRPGAECCGYRGAPDDPPSSSFVVPALRAQQRHRWMAKPRSEEEHRQLSSWARKASLSQTRQRSRIRCPSLV